MLRNPQLFKIDETLMEGTGTSPAPAAGIVEVKAGALDDGEPLLMDAATRSAYDGEPLPMDAATRSAYDGKSGFVIRLEPGSLSTTSTELGLGRMGMGVVAPTMPWLVGMLRMGAVAL